MTDLTALLTDHTFLMVVGGTTVIGLVAGALGVFAYLRRQSLISDVISHAALPGVLGAYLVGVLLAGVDGRGMIWVIAGSVVTGIAATRLSHWIADHSKIKTDAAMAISLTLFFGAGMLLLRVITNADLPGKGGLQSLLFGNASVITRSDLVTSLVVGGAALAIMLVCWRAFAHRTFDPVHSRVLGLSPQLIDGLMFASVVVATVIGVKTVGLVLMVAFVVTPPAAARQWVRSLPAMVALSAAFGAVGSATGALLSIMLGDVPTGPLIVLMLFGILTISLCAAPRRSIFHRARARRRARRELLAEFAGKYWANDESARPSVCPSESPSPPHLVRPSGAGRTSADTEGTA